MKLVPLGDKIVLTVRSRRNNKVWYRSSGTGKREAAGSGSHCCRAWRDYRWKRSYNAGQRWG